MGEQEEMEEAGWKQTHGDVFRTPQFPSLLSVFVGTGVQVITMVCLVLVFALLGFLSPAHRGGLLTSILLLFVFMSIFAGFYSSKLYKTFKGSNWKANAFLTSLMFPGVAFVILILLNFLLIFERSSGAVPVGTLLTLLILQFGIAVPLTFLGSGMGQRSEEYKFPCRVNKIPKPIKEQKWFLKTPFVMLVGGILPFGAIFIELMFIMRSIWT